MSKIKIPRKSTFVDMTAMVDMAFLLVTFFMLTTKFRPDEPVIVDTPKSISEIPIPEQNIMLITIDSTGRVFFGLDNQKDRVSVLRKVSEKYGIKFTPEQEDQFRLMSTFGMPIGGLQQLLDMEPSQRAANGVQPGIPCDSLKNELSDWVLYARLSNPKLRVAIKGDGKTAYPVIKRVMNTMQDKNVNRFNLITDLEAAPADMIKKQQ